MPLPNPPPAPPEGLQAREEEEQVGSDWTTIPAFAHGGFVPVALPWDNEALPPRPGASRGARGGSSGSDRGFEARVPLRA
jgi:hypothetical protein